MAETVVALLFAHVFADFLLQSGKMVREKRRPLVLLAHVAIVAGLSWLALGLPAAPPPILLVAGSHLVIDWLKLRFGGPGIGAFLLDQTAHLAMIALAAALFPGAYAAGLWAHPAVAALPGAALLPQAMLLAAAVVGAVWAGGYAVACLMLGLSIPPDPAEDPSLPQGGRMIGQLERLIILVLVLLGETIGIGFLITAKSILRFGEVQRSRQIAEYVIIGTLASFAWALVVAIAAARLLTSL
ncbi:hypothetical protein BH23PSE1_BH23PSE1_18450 [soil metagenome]